MCELREIVGKNSTIKFPEIFRVTVDYRLSLDEMVEKGNYYCVDSKITSRHFPHDRIRASQNMEVFLVHLGYTATVGEVFTELDLMGLRPATLPVLLAIGSTHPDLQRKFQIVALGSGWWTSEDRVYRAMIGSAFADESRTLGLVLFDWDDRWDDTDRFAAVHK